MKSRIHKLKNTARRYSRYPSQASATSDRVIDYPVASDSAKALVLEFSSSRVLDFLPS